MSLDGNPLPDNPFASGNRRSPSGYVWAYGLRNPFGLKFVNGHLFATENGPDVDAFLKIDRGRNFLWDGTDLSVGTGAEAVFSPSFSPVQLDHYPASSSLFPRQYRHNFFFAVAGHLPFKPPAYPGAGVISLGYDLVRTRPRAVPKYIVSYRGNRQQLVTGLAFGPDGLYFVPLLPNESRESAVIRMTFDPGAHYPFTTEREGALALFNDKGCLSCHQFGGQGGTVGPSLDTLRDRLEQRLFSPAYTKEVRALHDPKYQKLRDAVLATSGMDRIRLWVKTQIMSPGFDNPANQMPDLGVAESQAEAMTATLLGEAQEMKTTTPGGLHGLVRRIYRKLFGNPTPARAAFVGLLSGALLMVIAFGIWQLVFRRARRKRYTGGVLGR
jgi:Glucose / Sorbosone dehydrogenase